MLEVTEGALALELEGSQAGERVICLHPGTAVDASQPAVLPEWRSFRLEEAGRAESGSRAH